MYLQRYFKILNDDLFSYMLEIGNISSLLAEIINESFPDHLKLSIVCGNVGEVDII
jgi:hypothetical protein